MALLTGAPHGMSDRTGAGATWMTSGTLGWLGGRRGRIRRGEYAMKTTPAPKLMPELPRPGQKVRWRNPGEARACGWEALFGPGPFVVVRTVDHSAHGLATGLVLRTAIGEREIHEVWMALADEAGCGAGSARAVPMPSAICASALPQRR